MSRRLWIAFLVAPALAYLVWVFAGRALSNRARPPRTDPGPARRQAEFDAIYGVSGLRILHFYAPEGEVPEGGRATLCYGVLNARAVRIEPHVEGAGPALNRCVEVAPRRNTRYTLIAEGLDGSVASESLTLRVRRDPRAPP